MWLAFALAALTLAQPAVSLQKPGTAQDPTAEGKEPLTVIHVGGHLMRIRVQRQEPPKN